MGTSLARPAARVLAAFAGVALLATVATSPAAHAAAVEQLPDLRMKRLSGFYIQKAANGDKRLRFTTIVVNPGAGRFELRGSRPDTSTSRMTVTQRIYKSDGTVSRNIPVDRSDTYMYWAGDGHEHWHIYKLQRFSLRTLNNGVTGDVVGRGAKTGFCFFDNYKYNLSLSGAPQTAYYTGCGTRSSTRVKMGLSRGWGDRYSASAAYQWIKITGLKDGNYRVKAVADPYAWFVESNESNNYTWTDIHIGGGGTTVSIIGQGPSA